ncbi:MAG: hypothetical protein A3J83_05745 [Elusimicrobia bacterium RIFOXYA2_FULL_40_6]|nr:MAG: hypothetical protein A3J83_05745 [Elusimicrobia bacterium RIFOXYA2_FULL_40_6]
MSISKVTTAEGISPSIQDFSLIKTKLDKINKENNWSQYSNAFHYFMLDLILGLQEDEIVDSITDTNFLACVKKTQGHDRGIDAVYIEQSNSKVTIHLFNMKYAEKYEKLSNHFPSSEIDKILSFINSLLIKDKKLKDDVNAILYSKVEEIWKLFEAQNPCFVIHVCSNTYKGFEPKEKERFEREIGKHTNFKIYYHLMPDIVNRFTQKDKEEVNARIKAIDKQIFEKSDGDIRAIIVNVDVRDLLRIVLGSKEIRDKVDLLDYSILKNYQIFEDAFQDNVRVYLKQRSRINRSIKHTILSEDNYKFFYYNNGITITCKKFSYPKTVRDPIIELTDIQIVNGGQTIHALYDAFIENFSKFDSIDILCRIYETSNTDLSVKISEYTNSQNPVKSRDLRSIDFTQQKLEKEFESMGLFYERKKNQYSNKPKQSRIDAEKVGQVLMAFYIDMPAEAKNEKSMIFAEKYDDIFNDEINANKILLPYRLFEKIEYERILFRKKYINKPKIFRKDSYLLYASYYFLYILKKISESNKTDVNISNLDIMWKYYSEAKLVIKGMVNLEKQESASKGEEYSHASFFKSNKPKTYIDGYLQKRRRKK